MIISYYRSFYLFLQESNTNSIKPTVNVRNTSIYIILLIAGVLFSLPIHSIDKSAERLSKLQALIDDNLSYSKEVTNDSIIAWEKQLAPLLEKNKQYEALFELKQMVVCAYSIRGDISIAVDYARKMYDKARSLNFEIGIALSSSAIGDAYLNANMPKEAIGAYEEALQLFKNREKTIPFQAKILPKLIMTLIKRGELEKASIYLKQLDAIFAQKPSVPARFFMLASYTYYYIESGNTNKAKTLLNEVEKISLQRRKSDYYAIVDYLYAAYYQATGQYEKALELQSKLLNINTFNLAPNRYILLIQEQANLLAKAGRIDEACHIYQQANEKKDSLNTISYARQINDLRTTYQIDQLEIQSQIQRNQIILWAIIAIFLVLLLIAFMMLRIRIDNRRLIRSRIKLENAQKYAESSTKTKSLFLSNMSHEIRTPLNALSGFSAILTDESIDNETRQQCNEIIQQNSELLLKLINDVIDLSSLDVGKLTFNFRKCDAVSICRNVIDTVEKVKQTQASVTFHTSLSVLELLTDDSRLQQVLINLLINATKFTTQGTIMLELSMESDTTARFAVTDTGCGIPLKKQNQIFNRFEKLNEGAQGTGLGLSICQLIIEQIGGKIWIDPEYTGGARFIFTHPVSPVTKKEGAQ